MCQVFLYRWSDYRVGHFASDYFDVPEVAQMDSTSDTVSVVMIGIDPEGLDLPFDFNITITPHGANGDPITQITKPVRILKHHKGPTSGPNGCRYRESGHKSLGLGCILYQVKKNWSLYVIFMMIPTGYLVREVRTSEAVAVITFLYMERLS